MARRGIPTRGRRKTQEARGRRRDQWLGTRNQGRSQRPLNGQRVGKKLTRPWVSPKVSSESIFLEVRLSAACVSREGASCAAPLPLALKD